MTEESTPVSTEEEVTETPEAPTEEASAEPAADPIKQAYVVGLTEDGKVHFEHSPEMDLTTLLGLHRIAEQRVLELYDFNQKRGNFVNLTLLDNMQKQVNDLSSKVADVLKPATTL